MCSGIRSVSLVLERITAAACTPVPRVRPSTPLAVSMTFLTSGSFSYICRISPASPYRGCPGSKMPSKGMDLPMMSGGSALVIRSPWLNG